MFANRTLQNETKVLVYNAVVVPTLLYRCETWITYRYHVKSLEGFHQRCLWRIMHIRWDDYHTNADVLSAAQSTSIEAQIMKHQLRWAGHRVHMENTRIPKQVFYSQLSWQKIPG